MVFSMLYIMYDGFPFSSLSDLELLDLHSTDIPHSFNEDLLRQCNDFRFHTFQHTDYNTFEPEQDTDADNNFFHGFQVNCNYYTDAQFLDRFKTSNGFSIVHFNCRSLHANFLALQDYLNGLEYKFDVIAVSETWLTDNSEYSLFQLDGCCGRLR